MRLLLILVLGLTITSFTTDIAKNVRAKIYVVNESNEIVEGAKVTLYKTHQNYKNETKPVASGKTNEKGFIEFRDLQEIVYYMHVIKGGLNNNGGSVQTDTLHIKGKNRFEVMIN